MAANKPSHLELKREIYALTDAHLTGEIVAADAQHLADLVGNNSIARQYYLEFVHDSVQLRLAYPDGNRETNLGKRALVTNRDAPTDSTTTDTPSLPPSPRSKSWSDRAFWRELPPSIAVALVVMVVGLGWAAVTYVSKQVAEKGEEATSKVAFVAQLVHEVDSKWEVAAVENPVTRKREQVATGLKLFPGQKLKLASGLAVFRFDDGADVVLEGPAEFEVLSKKACGLSVGKLVARVEGKKAKGFTVDTPRVRVEDLGTEFGVEVGEDHDVEIHVYTGAIEWARRDAAGTFGRTRQLVKDEAVRVVSESKQTITLVASANRFVRPGDISLASGDKSTHVRAGGIVSDLVAHYMFDETTGTTARNSARNNSVGGDHAGTLKTTGSDTFSFDVQASRGKFGMSHKVGSGALAFDSDDFVDIGKSLTMPTEITLSAWVKISGFPAKGEYKERRHYVIGRMGPRRRRGTQFYVQDNGALMLVQYVANQNKETTTEAGVVTTGRWHHIAASRTASHQRLFVDGVLRATSRHAGPFHESISAAQIGTGFSTHGTPGAHGVMDDIRVYHRALGDADIAELFSQAQTQGDTP